MGRTGVTEWERSITPLMYEEFRCCTLQRIKQKILEFKQTRDPRLFSLLLLRFDLFVVYICHKFKRKYSFLYDVPLEDLYHTAIIATYKSFISMPDDWLVEKILLRIKSYIRSEFFIWFNDKVALKSCRLETYEWNLKEAESAQDLEDTAECSIVLAGLAEVDRILVINKIMKNKTYEELRDEFGGVTKQSLSVRMKKILKKIRSAADV